jgi:hypothetical protein
MCGENDQLCVDDYYCEFFIFFSTLLNENLFNKMFIQSCGFISSLLSDTVQLSTEPSHSQLYETKPFKSHLALPGEGHFFVKEALVSLC